MRRRIAVPVLAGLIALGAGACASAGGGSGGSRDEITLDQLSTLPNMSAYDAVRRLRPTWLRQRGQGSFRLSSTMIVVVNQMPQGGLDILSSLQIRDVTGLRYLDPQESTLRYGTDASGGAIVVEM